VIRIIFILFIFVNILFAQDEPAKKNKDSVINYPQKNSIQHNSDLQYFFIGLTNVLKADSNTSIVSVNLGFSSKMPGKILGFYIEGSVGYFISGKAGYDVIDTPIPHKDYKFAGYDHIALVNISVGPLLTLFNPLYFSLGFNFSMITGRKIVQSNVTHYYWNQGNFTKSYVSPSFGLEIRFSKNIWGNFMFIPLSKYQSISFNIGLLSI